MEFEFLRGGCGVLVSVFVSRGMRDMPLLTESMAPVVTSCIQAFGASSRSREVDEEAPRSKRMCASGERVYGGFEAGVKREDETQSQCVEEVGESDVFVPGTPSKDEESIEAVRKSAGGWESLELCLLERVSRSLSTSDLCQLAQVVKKKLHFRFPVFVGSVVADCGTEWTFENSFVQ